MKNRRHEEDLGPLRDKLLLMGGGAERAIIRSIRSLTGRDSDLAKRVIKEDDAIDRAEIEIDQMCVDILVSKPPTATDLRFAVSVARTAPMVERIGDHAVNISKHALALNNEPELTPVIDIAPMAKIVQTMLAAGLDAFTSGDPERARAIIARDDEVDALYDQLYEQVLHAMRLDPSCIARGILWIFVLKHLERIADYVTNICEQVVYMARGQVIKHTIW